MLKCNVAGLQKIIHITHCHSTIYINNSYTLLYNTPLSGEIDVHVTDFLRKLKGIV